ncbi:MULTISPECIES: hypothetical protein [unclassified Microbacterium]|uniref:hypothetical protein n=1 Tax=unclassified Microbacterium TaxID=2609290 RepID=UPI003422830B
MDAQGPTIMHDAPLDDTRTARRIRWFARRRFVLLTTVVVIPILLSLVLNSWGALTAESAWRMAVATVVGQTITICGAIIAVVLTIVQRRPAVAVIAFALLAAVLVLNALSTMDGAGQVLLDRLDLIAETAALDR